MKQQTTNALRLIVNGAHWWLSELSAGAHAILAAVAPRWTQTLTAYVSRTGIQIVDDQLKDAAPILDLALTPGGAELQAPLSASQPLSRLQPGGRVRIVLDPEFAFVHRVTWPLAILAHLPSAMNLQLPKLLPVASELLRTDYLVGPPNPDGSSIEIELAAIKRADVEPFEQALQRWHLRPTTVQLGSRTETQRRFRFHDRKTTSNRASLSRLDGYLAVCAVSLAMIAVTVFTVQSYRARAVLNHALEQTNDAAAAVLQQRQQLISRLETLSVLSAVERSPSAAAVLADVTIYLGHETWLTTFELKGRELRLIGTSPDPATVVKQLNSSALLSDLELKSSLAAGPGKDRFEIVAHVKGPS